MNTESTSCYSYFLIKSNGTLDYYKGFIPDKNSNFDPDEITKVISIEPFKVIKYGTLKGNGKSTYNFSAWFGCRQAEPMVSRSQQCLNIVLELKLYIAFLKAIKEKYNVCFTIEVFPCDANTDVIDINHEIIDFCYQTGTEIVVDTFLYSQKA